MHYSAYLVIVVIIWSINAISYFIVGLNCKYIHDPNLNIFVTVCNVSKISLPFILTIYRYLDPGIRLRVKKIFNSTVNQNEENLLELGNDF